MRPPVNTDERPFVLVWELTQACELACKHCRAEAEPCRHPDELSTAEGKRLLESVSDFGNDQLVVFSGGDPLYRDDTLELIKYGRDLGLLVTVTPSGTASLSPDRIADLADAGVRRLALSLDGADSESHDGFRQEEGSFEQTLKAAKHAREVGLPLQINTTVCSETHDGLSDLSELVADLEAVLWSVFFLVPVGRGLTLNPVTPAVAERTMEWLRAVEDEADFAIKTTEAPQYRRVRTQERNEDETGDMIQGKDHRGIIAGDGFVFISHRGEVYPSGFLPHSVGNVRDEDITEIYRSDSMLNRLRDRDELKGKCGACPFRYVCGGSRSRAYAYTGDPLESDPLCPYVPPSFDGELPRQDFADYRV